MAYTDICGSKLRAKMGSTLNESAAQNILLTASTSTSSSSSKSTFAARQMAKMGWEQGTGLGKKRNGIVQHIRVTKRDDNSGLGNEKEVARQMGNMWWEESVGNTLLKLQQRSTDTSDKKKKTKKDNDEKKKKKKKKKKRDDAKGIDEKDDAAPSANRVFTDEELFQATGGARFGMRAQRRAEGKWKRTESSKHMKQWEDRVKETGVEWNGLGKAKTELSCVGTTVRAVSATEGICTVGGEPIGLDVGSAESLDSFSSAKSCTAGEDDKDEKKKSRSTKRKRGGDDAKGDSDGCTGSKDQIMESSINSDSDFKIQNHVKTVMSDKEEKKRDRKKKRSRKKIEKESRKRLANHSQPLS